MRLNALESHPWYTEIKTSQNINTIEQQRNENIIYFRALQRFFCKIFFNAIFQTISFQPSSEKKNIKRKCFRRISYIFMNYEDSSQWICNVTAYVSQRRTVSISLFTHFMDPCIIKQKYYAVNIDTLLLFKITHRRWWSIRMTETWNVISLITKLRRWYRRNNWTEEKWHCILRYQLFLSYLFPMRILQTFLYHCQPIWRNYWWILEEMKHFVTMLRPFVTIHNSHTLYIYCSEYWRGWRTVLLYGTYSFWIFLESSCWCSWPHLNVCKRLWHDCYSSIVPRISTIWA